jgi:hypothetical protein
MANVPSADDLLQQLSQLPAAPPAQGAPGMDTSTAPPVSDSSALMRLRQFLTGAVSGAGGGSVGVSMSPAMLLSNLGLEALGGKPVVMPTPEEIATKALDYAGLPSQPAKKDLLGNILTATGATVGAPALGVGVRALAGDLPSLAARDILPQLAPVVPAITSGVGSGLALTGAEKYFPNSPLAQQGASLVGGILGAGPALATGPTQISQAAERQGVLGGISAADATGNPMIAMLQHVLRMSPGGELAASQKAERALNINPSEPLGILPQRIEDVAGIPGVPVLGRDALGEHVALSADAANARYLQRLEQARTDANQVIGGARVDVTPIRDWMANYLGQATRSGREMNPDTYNPALREAQSILDAADANGTVSIEGLLDKRTSLGQMAFSRDPAAEFQVPPTGQPGLVNLYGTVGEALRQGAQDAAGDAGRRALQRVDDVVTQFRSPAPGQPTGASTPAKALTDYGGKLGMSAQRLMADIKGGDLSRLAAAKSQMTPEEWNGVAASVWQNLWTPKAGGNPDLVSPSSGLTAWNEISPGAKDLLFGAPSRSPQPVVPQTGATNFAPRGWRDAMDDLANVAKGMRRTADMGNPSRSGMLGGSAAMMAAVFYPLLRGDFESAAYGAGAIASAYPAQKLLQSTPFVRALTNQLAGGAGYWPTTMQRLTLLANANPEMADAIKSYITQVDAAMPQQQPRR